MSVRLTQQLLQFAADPTTQSNLRVTKLFAQVAVSVTDTGPPPATPIRVAQQFLQYAADPTTQSAVRISRTFAQVAVTLNITFGPGLKTMATKIEPYRSVDDAETYFANRLHSTVWTAASDADKLIALLAAARAIDSLRFTGYKVPVYDALVADSEATQATLEAADATQNKAWPRDSDTMVPDTPSTIQTLAAYTTAPTAGNVTVMITLVDGTEITTALFGFDSNATVIQAAIDAAFVSGLTGYTAGDIAITGGPLTTTDVTMTFSGASVSDNAHGRRPVVSPDATFLIDGVLATQPSSVMVLGECPDRVFWAQCEEAISLLSGKIADQEFENLVMTSDGVASTRVSSDRSQMPPQHTSHFFTSATAWKYLQGFLDEDNATFSTDRA